MAKVRKDFALFRFKKSGSLKFWIISAEVRIKKSMTISLTLMHKISRLIVTTGLLISVFLVGSAKSSPAFEFNDAVAIGAAYMTHLGMHEVGHQVVAEDVGADTPRMKFFTRHQSFNGCYFRTCGIHGKQVT